MARDRALVVGGARSRAGAPADSPPWPNFGLDMSDDDAPVARRPRALVAPALQRPMPVSLIFVPSCRGDEAAASPARLFSTGAGLSDHS